MRIVLSDELNGDDVAEAVVESATMEPATEGFGFFVGSEHCLVKSVFVCRRFRKFNRSFHSAVGSQVTLE